MAHIVYLENFYFMKIILFLYFGLKILSFFKRWYLVAKALVYSYRYLLVPLGRVYKYYVIQPTLVRVRAFCMVVKAPWGIHCVANLCQILCLYFILGERRVW